MVHYTFQHMSTITKLSPEVINITISYLEESTSIYCRVIYLLLYVDDMLIASKSRSAIDKLKKKDLSFKFEMKDPGEAKKVLGMEIERDRKSGKFNLTQKGYAQKVLQKFNINGDTKTESTPLASHFKLKVTMSPTTVEEREYMTRVPYASAVGTW